LSDAQLVAIAGCDLAHTATVDDAVVVIKSVTDVAVDICDIGACDITCGSPGVCFCVCFDLSSRRTCCSSDISASSFSAARLAISCRFIFFLRAFVSFSISTQTALLPVMVTIENTQIPSNTVQDKLDSLCSY